MVTKQECMEQLDVIEKQMAELRSRCEDLLFSLVDIDKAVGGMRYALAESKLPQTSGRRRTCTCEKCSKCKRRARQARWAAKRKSLHADCISK